jgi:hypothetical protein
MTDTKTSKLLFLVCTESENLKRDQNLVFVRFYTAWLLHLSNYLVGVATLEMNGMISRATHYSRHTIRDVW